MAKYSLVLTAPAILLLISSALPQTNVQTGTQQIDTTDSQLSAGAAITLHASAATVPLDVVVTNAHGDLITHLNRSEFRVYEDGVEQHIDTFQEHHVLSPDLVSQRLAMPPNIYTNYSTVPVSSSSLNVILLDALNTPMDAQVFAHAKVLECIRKLPRGSAVAIFTLHERLHMLQGFTTDPTTLIAALGSAKSLQYSAAFYNDLNQESLNDLTASLISVPKSASMLAMEKFARDENGGDAAHIQMRADLTERAFVQLAGFLNGLPGRKNLIWISGSFPLSFDPEEGVNETYSDKPPLVIQNGGSRGGATTFTVYGAGGGPGHTYSTPYSYVQSVNHIIDLFTHADVAVYTIDPRGPRMPSIFKAQDDDARYAGHPDVISNDIAGLFVRTTGEHATQATIAQATGGAAFYNSGDIGRELNQAIRQGGNYYSLSYSPINRKLDGKFRKISVHLVHPHYSLSYRRGYYAIAQEDHVVSDSGALDSAMQAAIRRGAPPYSEIPMKVRILSDDGDKLQLENAATPEPGAQPQKYAIDYSVLTPAVSFAQTADHYYKAQLEFVTIDYREDGKVYNSVRGNLSFDLTPETYQQVLTSGIRFHQEVQVPRGVSFLHIAVHDLRADSIGSLELPLHVQQATMGMQADSGKKHASVK